jgi:alginate O-acetyltransferase complex protein AlgJ
MRHTKANRILGTLLILSLLGGLLLSLQNPAVGQFAGHGDVRTGEWMQSFQSEFEAQLPLRNLAIGVWTALRYLVFREGRTGVMIGADDWLFTDEEFTFSDDDELYIDHNLAFVRQMYEQLQNRGIDLVVALVPSKARIYPQWLGRYRFPDTLEPRYREALAALRRRNIPAVDLEAALRMASDEAEVFLKTDTHWTPHGARAVAQEIATVALPILERRETTRTRFVLEELSPASHRGDLLNFLPMGPLAGLIGPQAETVTRFRAREIESGPIGLFDELTIPITLIGTSYSAGETWNLEAHLKVALGADVLNLAQQGRGPFGPMQDYVNGPTIDDVPAALVVWEIPERYLPMHR